MNKYLTHTGDFLGLKKVIVYNTAKLYSLEIWNESYGNIKNFDTLQDLQNDYNYNLKYKHKISNKKEFDKEYINYTKNLNKIAKEL